MIFGQGILAIGSQPQGWHRLFGGYGLVVAGRCYHIGRLLGALQNDGRFAALYQQGLCDAGIGIEVGKQLAARGALAGAKAFGHTCARQGADHDSARKHRNAGGVLIGINGEVGTAQADGGHGGVKAEVFAGTLGGFA